MTECIPAWLWLRDDRTLPFPPHTRMMPGETLHADGALALHTNGMYGSFSALDALRYAPGFIVARTRHGGEILYGEDRLCSRTLIACWIIDARMIVLDWLCAVYERGLAREHTAGREPDAR